RRDARLVVRRLERPNAPSEPLEERQVVGHSAEERLAEVHVRLHESGDDSTPLRVDDTRLGSPALGRHSADRSDPAAFDHEVAAEHAALVARHDGPPSNERPHGALPYTGFCAVTLPMTPRILIASIHIAVREEAFRALAERGYEGSIATTANEAAAALVEGP